MLITRIKQGLYILAVAMLFNACTDDNSADPNVPGSDRDKYVGDWLCRETVSGQSNSTTFTITIQKHGSEDTLYVYNFNNIGIPIYTIWLVSGNSVTIPNQVISQVALSGSGFYNNDEINLTYSSDGDAVSAVCTN